MYLFLLDFQCWKCPKTFKSNRSLNYHLVKAHEVVLSDRGLFTFFCLLLTEFVYIVYIFCRNGSCGKRSEQNECSQANSSRYAM